MKQKGFSLISIIGVILVFGIIGYYLGPNLFIKQHQPDVLWKFKLPESVLGGTSPLVNAKYVVIQTGQKEIVAIDRNNGQKKWFFTVPEDIKFFTGPILTDKVVVTARSYTKSAENTLYALDIETGKVIWNIPIIAYGKRSSESSIYVMDDSYIYRIDTSTGKEQWRIAVNLGQNGRYLLEGFDGGAYDNNVLYFGLYINKNEAYYYAIDTNNGQVKWKTNLNGVFLSKDPVILDGKLYIHLGSPFNYGPENQPDIIGEFDINTGKELSRTDSSSLDFIINGNTLYKVEGEYGKLVVAENLQNKTNIWTYKGSNINDIMLDKDILYVVSGSRVVALSASSGKKLWDLYGAVRLEYKFADGLYIIESGSTGIDSPIRILSKIDTKNKKKLWKFPYPIISKIKGMNDVVYFISQTYLYAVK